MKKEKLRQEKNNQDKLRQDNEDFNKKWSIEIDRRRSELRESNELIRCEIVETKEKDEAAKAVRKQSNDDLKLEMSAEVDRRRSELHESNKLSRCEIV